MHDDYKVHFKLKTNNVAPYTFGYDKSCNLIQTPYPVKNFTVWQNNLL